ncbi:hypothetical protein DL765_008316 [Monosporascus sp. GIB2]|nr:hypothetical protein DL765_008316 [Monosporascus sp. GIB2]
MLGFVALRNLGFSLVILDDPGSWLADDNGRHAHPRERFIPFDTDPDIGFQERLKAAVGPAGFGGILAARLFDGDARAFCFRGVEQLRAQLDAGLVLPDYPLVVKPTTLGGLNQCVSRVSNREKLFEAVAKIKGRVFGHEGSVPIEALRVELHQAVLRLGFTSGVFHVESRVRNSSLHYAAQPDGDVELVERPAPPTGPPSAFHIEVNARPPGSMT